MKKQLLFFVGTLFVSANASAAERSRSDAAGYMVPDKVPGVMRSEHVLIARQAGLLPCCYFWFFYNNSRSYVDRTGIRYVDADGVELSKFATEKIEVRHRGRRLKRDALFKAYAAYLGAHSELEDSPGQLEEYLILRGRPQQIFLADNPDELANNFAEFYEDLDNYGKGCFPSMLKGVRSLLGWLGRGAVSFDEVFSEAMFGYRVDDAAMVPTADEAHPHEA